MPTDSGLTRFDFKSRKSGKSRSELLGMISTHWCEPHQPTERALRRLDVLARQAADLIERSRTEAALRESNDQLRRLASIVECSHDAIYSLSLDGIITSWNKGAEQIFGYATEEVIGRPITILIPADRQDEELAILERVRQGERIKYYETVRQRKDGSLIVLSLSVSPIRNAEGEIVGASEIARDITERKRSEEQIATLAREAEHRVKNCWQRSRPPLIFLSLKHSTASNALLKDAFRPSRMSTRCS